MFNDNSGIEKGKEKEKEEKRERERDWLEDIYKDLGDRRQITNTHYFWQ